jgi:hypothetical protein
MYAAETAVRPSIHHMSALSVKTAATPTACPSNEGDVVSHVPRLVVPAGFTSPAAVATADGDNENRCGVDAVVL